MITINNKLDKNLFDDFYVFSSYNFSFIHIYLFDHIFKNIFNQKNVDKLKSMQFLVSNNQTIWNEIMSL